MKILVVGDSYISADAFGQGLAELRMEHRLEFLTMNPDQAFQPRTPSEERLTEFEGNPDQLADALTDHDVLVVHGAPVTESVLKASPNLKLICCARGGPVNVDLDSAKQLGIPVFSTPGKNAPAVAELTIALLIMLIRGIAPAMTYLFDGGEIESAFDGARFFGREVRDMQLGLIGFGLVGTEVARRALSLGMDVSAYDPYVHHGTIAEVGVRPLSLVEVVAGSDVVSLHARQTPETRGLVDASLLAQFRPGAFFINTAREGMVDEEAILEALLEGRLAGVAADVFEAGGSLAKAVLDKNPRLILLPHLGGATYETIERASMRIAEHITRCSHEQLANPSTQ